MSGYTDGTFRPENNMTRAEAVVMLYRLCDISSSVSVTDSTYRDVVNGSWYAQAVNTFQAAGILDSTTYFYPDQAITRGDFVDMIYRLMGSPTVSSSGPTFTDTNNSAVRYAASRGWISGYSDGSFRPYNGLARSEAASLMTRLPGPHIRRNDGLLSRCAHDILGLPGNTTGVLLRVTHNIKNRF